MKALVEHLVKGVVSHPVDVHVNAVEGEASLLLELSVHPSDRAALEGNEGETLHAIRTVLAASSGRRKAVLELVSASDAGEE